MVRIRILKRVCHIFTAVLHKLEEYGRLVMISHTVFSLAFGVVAFLTASGGQPSFRILFWASLALLSARTGANALNRAVDAKIDAKNPRTQNRQIPQGQITVRETLALTGLCFFLLIVSAWQLNPVCFWLSPLALLLMSVYSYTKRFTWLCHLVLGITCACAPAGAWLAVTGRFSAGVFLLGGANCLWTAGFDIIYGTQDYEFDKANGLHSIPVRFGIRGALWLSALFHLGALAGLAAFGLLYRPDFGFLYFTGLLLISILVFIQHKIVSPENLDQVTIASYSISQITAVVFLFFGVLDIYF